MQERPKRLHPFWDLIKSGGGFIQKCLKELHPFFALIKSDGGCHSQANRKSQKRAPPLLINQQDATPSFQLFQYKDFSLPVVNSLMSGST